MEHTRQYQQSQMHEMCNRQRNPWDVVGQYPTVRNVVCKVRHSLAGIQCSLFILSSISRIFVPKNEKSVEITITHVIQYQFLLMFHGKTWIRLHDSDKTLLFYSKHSSFYLHFAVNTINLYKNIRNTLLANMWFEKKSLSRSSKTEQNSTIFLI